MKRSFSSSRLRLLAQAPLSLVQARCGRTNAYPIPSWVLPLPRSERLANALGGWNRGYPADPYWDPCLSYQRNWGPGACGGND